MKIVVIGGAGYIGSHAVKLLVERGHDVVAVDNLTNGHRGSVNAKARLEVLDCANTAGLAALFKLHGTQAVMHFAANAYVGESVSDPRKYYRNNVGNTISMLDAMRLADVKRLVFSSTCATYGEPKTVPITEDLPQNPISPYGMSKLMVEKILLDCAHAENLAFAAPRYFNVAGAAMDGTIGEDHRPESHIIPIVLQAALGQRSHVDIYGNDYPTPDGTCIRDYIHVKDLAQAHILGLQPGKTGFYNLGNGDGYSVRQVIQMCEKITGKTIPAVEKPRRPGDPPRLVAAADKAVRELGWKPEYPKLEDIVSTAWAWHQTHPDGYAD